MQLEIIKKQLLLLGINEETLELLAKYIYAYMLQELKKDRLRTHKNQES